MMIAAVILVIAAAMASAYSSYESGQQQKKAADFNSQVAEGNANQARQAAAAKAEQFRTAGERRLSQMRQQYAKAGVDVEGTPLTVLMDSSEQLAKDELRIKSGGESSAWSFMSESELQRSAGQSASMGGNIGAGASLLGGAARATSIYAGSTK